MASGSNVQSIAMVGGCSDLLIAVSGGRDYKIDIVFEDQTFSEKLSTILAEPESDLAHLVRETCFGSSGSNLEDFPVCREVRIMGRSSRLFQFVLNYLRHGQRAILPSKQEDLLGLLEECKFFQVFGLATLVWCLIQRIRLQVYQAMDVNTEVVWNPAAVPLFWESVTVMSRCYFTHRARYLVCGYIRAKTDFSGCDHWWCYDVVCPSCQQYDFAPVNDNWEEDFGKYEVAFKKRMTDSKGRIVKRLEGGSCALVEWPDFSWKFHVPFRALLPASYRDFSARSR